MRHLSSLAGIACALLLSGAVAGCSSLRFFAANAPAFFGSFHRSRDLPYGTDARQRLDVYSPSAPVRDAPPETTTTGRAPIVVFFYGGSWTMGQKSQYAFVGAALATRGYVTVIPDYRLYPQVSFPLFMRDAAQAVAWVQKHAHQFGGDPDRIVLMGHSAGAHIAALLALNGAYLTDAGLRPHTIVGLIGLSGPYALAPDSDTLRSIFASPYTPEDWQPVHFASAQAPPTLH